MALEWGGWSNGYIPLAKMTAIPDVTFAPLYSTVTVKRGANRLMPEAARQLGGLARAFKAKFGTPLIVSEAYRPYIRQLETWDIYQHGGNPAAYPGTSNHGWGRSVDLANGIGTWSSATHVWMATNGPKYGFYFTVASEGWHMDYLGSPSIIASASVAKPVVIKPKPLPKLEGSTRMIAYVKVTKAGKATEKVPSGAPVGRIYAIDFQNRTVRYVTFDHEINLAPKLMPEGKLIGIAGSSVVDFVERGWKKISW